MNNNNNDDNNNNNNNSAITSLTSFDNIFISGNESGTIKIWKIIVS